MRCYSEGTLQSKRMDIQCYTNMNEEASNNDDDNDNNNYGDRDE